MAAKKDHPVQDLFSEINPLNQPQLPAARVTGIQRDSRKVSGGEVFVAVPGTRVDGHSFITQAVDRGARLVVGSQPAEKYQDLPVPYLQVEDAREALALLTAAWCGYPARSLTVIGVTGTDGKTTTVNFIYQILKSAGLAAGMVSTVKAVVGEETLDTGFHVTTPEAADLQQYLARMVEAGLTHVVIEATSHGLAQKRVWGCDFDIGVVTNITHEHLDYHGSYREYLDAKASLFTLVARSQSKPWGVKKTAVLNRDDRAYPELKKRTQDLKLRAVSYSQRSNQAVLRARKIREGSRGVEYELLGGERKVTVRSSLGGLYNVSNSLAALAACHLGLGIDLDTAREGIARLERIPGRMEAIDLGQDFTAIVDFAHTPNALRSALSSVKEKTDGRVIAVFGSAGLRDREKRRLMAEISARLADATVLTAEDPRTEDLDTILEEMAAGAVSQGGVEEETFWRVPDRGEAIRTGLRLAAPGDVVIVCGKGHEQSMCFGETEYPWDDRTALRAALAEHLGKPGPAMPYLPTQA